MMATDTTQTQTLHPHQPKRQDRPSLVILVPDDVRGLAVGRAGRLGHARVPLVRGRRAELDRAVPAAVVARAVRGVAPARGVEADERDDERVQRERDAGARAVSRGRRAEGGGGGGRAVRT